MSVGRSIATGAWVALFSINSRAACIMPWIVEGARYERSVTGLASSAYTASELMYTAWAISVSESAAHTVSAIFRFCISPGTVLAGALADTITMLSSGRSRPLSLAVASSVSRSSSLRVNGRTETPSAASCRAIALPTNPPAPIITARTGLAGMAFLCSSMS